MKKKIIKLELNEMEAEVLIQCLRKPGDEVFDIVKLSYPEITPTKEYDIRRNLEEQIVKSFLS